MVSFTRHCRKASGLFLLVMLTLVARHAAAEGIERVTSEVHATASGVLVLSAAYRVTLTPALVDALQHGVPLSFALDLEMTEPRWYWFDKMMLDWHQERRITYNALTRTYRYYLGSIYLTFNELSEALAALSSVQPVSITPDSPWKKDTVYRAILTFRLDTSSLPKPFQLDALYTSDWNLAASPYEWTWHP